ncbi:MAG: hypothetical protein B9S33_04945 [Pedosphaera sp. Tous-C6FEB]|nr:MAG: hypothetical protein B9S33_04945 [Pedosphaera sp. Tous-C6FEB]
MKKLIKTLGHALGLSLLLAASTAGADVVTVSGSITSSTTWFATNTYHLVGKVYVQTGANLTIEAGTIVKGTNDNTLFGALFICQGAKIFAQGTPDRPIVFTSTADNIGTAGAWPNLGIYDRGLWGGIVLLGNATLNSAADATGNLASPKYGVFEGLPDQVINGQNVHRYGGSNDADSSGVMRYVSIRHGGKRLESNKEINGLTFCGVGNSSVIEFVEAYAIADDGFEFFGGTVNTRYLVSAFNDDDAFDTDEGYRGSNQFWFGIQENGAKDSGFEIDGDAPNSGVLPTSQWKVWNATILGSGAANGQGSGNAFTIREFAAPSFHNGIFGDFARRGISIDANAGTHIGSGALDIANNIFFAFGTSDTVTNIGITASAQAFLSDATKTNLIVNPQLAGISRINDGGLDPRPLAGSPALNPANVKPVTPGGFIVPTDYLGAFGPDNLWIAKWTTLSQYGVMRPNGNLGQNIVTISGSLTGTNSWSRTNIYHLVGKVYVENNAVLNIEAGTIIKGTNDSTLFGSLFITRGAKIFARGTAQNPIIFTSTADNIGTAGAWPNLGIYDRGLWGGIVLLGHATLNSAADATGNLASPKYGVFEGLPDQVINGQNVHRYGGNDDADSSGVMRYVSIRHGGKRLESNKEINGLTFCGVGNGTTIEFIEAYAIADDGFEFFGGTVNTKWLVSAFNDDDAFDTDEGYRGLNQFWFGIQENGAKDSGLEIDGDAPNSGVLPTSEWKIWNATILGSGAANGQGSGNALTIREFASPTFVNGIFGDFARRGVSIDANAGTHIASGKLDFQNNIFFGFGTSDTVTNIGITAGAQAILSDAAKTNLIVNPQLAGISRVPGFGLDPRPVIGSPALSAANVKPTVANGFYVNAPYIGAFGDHNWAADWTTLGAYGIMTANGARIPQTTPLQATAPVINAQPAANTVANAGSTINLSANIAGAASFQWYKNGVAIPGAISATLTLNNVRGSAGLDHTGPSSSRPPFQEAVDSGYALVSIISVGDIAGTNPDGSPRRTVGVMDGLGAYDNGDGTFTVLANHEINETSGIVRRHGAKGAFITKFVINKANLAVLTASDLITNVYVFNTNTSAFNLGANVLMGRFCSADLPAPTAFFNAATGKGSQEKIFMNGEEFSTESRAWAHIATGPEAGNSWQLPRFGRASWENVVPSPFAQDKTIVAGLDDDGTTDSQVYFYIGTKQATGTNEVEKAGLLNGSLYGVSVTGLAQEVAGTTAVQRNFTLFNLGDVSTQTFDGLEQFGNTNGVTAFQRVEDGAWDPANPRDFYFLTTASFSAPSRLWRLRFNDIANPEAGGVIDMLLDGTEGIKMMDNLGFDNNGNLLIQEDVGNQSHNGKTWKYVPSTDQLILVSQHRPNLVTTGQPGFLTQDEEASGIIDVTHILGYKAYLIADQMHGGTASFGAAGVPAGASITELVENGQIQLMVEVANGAYTLVAANGNGSVTSSVANVTITAPPAIADTLFRNGLPGATVSSGGTLVLNVPTNAVAGTGPFTYQWFLNGNAIPLATSSTLTVPGFVPGNAGNYSVQIGNAAGQSVSVNVPVSTADIAFFGGVSIDGPANAKYRIEFLSDVSNTNSWTSLTNIVHQGGRQFYIDTTSDGRARRFFRAVPTP